MVAIPSTPIDHIYSTENHMFSHEPVGRTYHRAFFYATGCSEAVLTYVPQDADGFVRAHMWIGAGQYSSDHSMCSSILPVHGFPGATHSLFVDAYSVLYYLRHSSLPRNQAIAVDHTHHCDLQWSGDVLVIKHIGHNFHTYQSMTYDEKALVDAILTW
ncbi:uncharacterized protein HD556DRAFT_1448090 [Suillus plorans]|uniref:Uncharacterized protein n=1 Tax=Suillus plorans TaxID=116603 RepID=A0A9P7AF33_9AGAM|nr:uncharacterized protein HD556DRAFT_1448090 [Suillus plorans]KAG1788106.1 hypothetical protein HD556DRAFT_1448090 [Suillus plorans]